MTASDPFTDAAFSARLQKLLSLLGSEQPGEADAARRKLLEHLAHHRLSLTDLAMRLRESVPAHGSFLQGGREIGLERELTIARTARREAEAEALAANHRAVELHMALQQSSFDIGRALRAQGQARMVAAAGWIAAAILGCLALVSLGLQPHLAPAAPASPPASAALPAPETGAMALRMAPGERNGTVLIQDLPVRLAPNDDADVRSYLNRGSPVVIFNQALIGTQFWLEVRSVSGSGWVRAGAILR